MGRYITHEQLPFKGKLVKIRMRSYGFSNVASQLQNEEELLEITPDGNAKLSATRIDGREKCKVQIPVDDAAYIFNAFTTVFSEYKKEKVPGYSGFWKVRLLTDEDEVFFYHGSNGQDYMYEGKTLTEILRERTTLEELNGFAMRIDEKSHVSSIDISFRQTVAEDAAEKVAEKNHQPMEDISRTYQITVLYSDKKSASYSGSFDKEGLPDNWADFISRVAAFFDTESLGELFDARTFDRVPAKADEVVFCGVEILGVVGVRYYRCDDDVCLNDVVVVPTPAKKQNLDGHVVEIRRCKVTAIPKELQKAKDVLYTIKDKDAENHG